MQEYHLRDFKVPIDSQDAPRPHNEEAARTHRAPGTAQSQSEHDWAYAKRALARGDDSEEVIRRIADYRANDKSDPVYYARHTVSKAQEDLQRRTVGADTRSEESDRTDERTNGV
jgi:hypothetical protein